jgi:hypothetical protein
MGVLFVGGLGSGCRRDGVVVPGMGVMGPAHGGVIISKSCKCRGVPFTPHYMRNTGFSAVRWPVSYCKYVR